MANYELPATAEERVVAIKALQEEFAAEHATFKEKGKKASAFKARKALLNIAKLTKAIRIDIQAELAAAKEAKK